MMTTRSTDTGPFLRYQSLDPEARFGFPAGHGTTPSSLTCLLLTTVLSAAAYGSAYGWREHEWGAVVWEYMTAFGRIPIPIILLSIWSLVFLFVKSLKIRAQRAA